MKTETAFYTTLLSIILSTSFIPLKSQNTIVVAPSDVVVSRNFSFDIALLTNPDDSTFGRIHKNAMLLKPIITRDIVCASYCKENLYIGYPAYKAVQAPPKPAPFLACEYYTQFFDSTQVNRLYDLNWGLDGYILNGSPNDPIITIQDLRHCGQGTILRILSATDSNNKTIRDTQTIWFVDCNFNPPQNLVCQSDLNLNLDSKCSATIDASLMLVGTGYCYELYPVELRDWISNKLIDRDSTKAGSQVNFQDIGRTIKVTVKDPGTGGHCDGVLMVHDNTPPILSCPPDLSIRCGNNENPFGTGIAGWQENCGTVNLSYKDFNLYGGCDKVYEKIIRRTWTASDNSNNKSNCLQIIQINNAAISDVKFPPDFDDLAHASLKCDERIDINLNISSFIVNHPSCVSGFLLDSVYWNVHSAEPDIYPNRRLPRILGWNSILESKNIYFGHPSPESIYYPAHKDWSLADPYCWGADQHVMWEGTGLPIPAGCQNLAMVFTDSIVIHTSPNCMQSHPTCYDIYRIWTVLDWCTSTTVSDTQVIKIKDTKGPQILYPDTILASIETYECKGRLEVSPPWIIDNCSNEVHYTVEVDSGIIEGNDSSGFVITNLSLGFHTINILAEDCCGNITQKKVVVLVEDNSPPNAVCQSHMVISITGNMSPGKNRARLWAKDLDYGSIENCGPVFFKIIKLGDLKGTDNGSNADQKDDGINCAAFNGDNNANLDGNQIYFNDTINICCSEVGYSLIVVLRVFEKDPGIGPVDPSRMDPGGDLYRHFSDCITIVEAQDRTVPSVVAPPNMVVSCDFKFDMAKLMDPNDSTFGKIVSDLSYRSKVHTHDKVCSNYCIKNDITGYPGYVSGAPPSNPPAPNRACDYYKTLFDSTNTDAQYDLLWGFDGYVLSSCDKALTISIDDMRKCSQGRIDRTISATGPNGITITATQTIWIVQCNTIKITAGSSGIPNNGFATIDLTAEIIDNCYTFGDETLSYEIDEFNDGLGNYSGGFDYKVGPLSLQDYNLGKNPQFKDNPRAFDSRNPFNASGNYPIGKHKIEWTSMDPCGNIISSSQLFEIKKTVSTKNVSADQKLIIMPNPSNGNVLIKSESQIDHIELILSTGVHYQKFVIPNKHSINLSNLPAGIYFIMSYRNKMLVATGKLVVIN